MATTLEELIANLQKNQGNSYQPLTSEQIKQKATNRYSTLYDQKRLDLENEYETSRSALDQQLAGLQQSYDKERKATAENYRQTYSQADRQALGRGMQRSSYNNAILANINLKGAEAQGDIDAAQRTAEGNIGEQQKFLAQQYAKQKNQYNASQANDIMAYIDELEAREYERTQSDAANRNNLAMQLYQYQFQKEQADQDQANWQKQYDAQYGGSASGGGGSYTPPSTNNGNQSNSLWELLNGGSNSGSTAPTDAPETNASAITNRLSAGARAYPADAFLGTFNGSGYRVRRN